jgi:Ca2+-binding EF-hand superfamily protein
MLLRTEIEKYDRWRTGEVPASQMLFSLHQCGLQLGSGEYETLSATYQTSRGNIDWRRLCRDVDDEAVHREPVAGDEAPAKSPRQLLSPLKCAAMNRLAELALRVGFNFRDEFVGQDRYKRGLVSEAQFRRVVEGLGGGRELQQVLMAYRIGQEFDYLSFCRDVEAADRSAEVVVEKPELVGAIRHYRAHLIARLQDSRSIFARFDLANAGHVRLEHVQTAFLAAGIGFGKEEYAALIGAFCDAGRFFYRRLDERAAKEGITPAQIRFLINPTAVAGAQAKQITWILVEIKNKLAERKKRVGALFLALESPEISADDFRQRLDRAELLIEKEHVDMLVEAYAGRDKKHVDWKRFVTDCELAVGTST